MAEAVVVPEQTTIPVATAVEAPNPFDEGNWKETPAAMTVPAAPPAPAAPAAKPEDDEVVNSEDFFRTNFGWDSLDAGKREVEELRKLKTAQPTAPSFANETSEKIFNYLKEGKTDAVYDYLDRERKLSAVDKMPGGDAIKLQIQQANPHYSAEDIQDVFEERYTLPEKPQSDGDDTDPTYVAQLAKWQDSVNKINRRVERDAFSARQDLAKLHTQLVLPDIQKIDPNAAATAQKELESLTAARNGYLAALESDGTKFSGYNAEYKDEEVTIPISYAVTADEQTALKGRLTEFDIDGYFANRWFKDGKSNIPLIQEDLYLLENKGKVFQKLVNESAKKMLDHRIKQQNNINVTGQGNTQTFQPTGDKTQQEADYLWANS